MADTSPYLKPPLSIAAQLALLKQRRLTIEHEEKALHLLEHLSYYRLSGYWYPLLADKANHIFKENASFEQAFSLYCFDRELRRLLLGELEKIEIAIRAKLVYILSHSHDAFWFQDPALFSNPKEHDRTLSKIKEEYHRSDEEFIRSFKEKYSNPLPPSWIILEITSFGVLSMLYKNLKSTPKKKEISNHFGLDKTTLISWLHCFGYIRNICAHHSRLWNKQLRIQPVRPKTPKLQWLINDKVANNKVYYALSMILYLHQTVNPSNTFTSKFLALHKGCATNINLGALGFPKNWQNEPLWQEKNKTITTQP